MHSAAPDGAVPDPIPELEVERVAIDGRVLLNVSGEVDVGTVLPLKQAIDAALGDGVRELWLDLSGVGFLDSTGVHTLLDLRRRMAATSGRIAVICPEGSARRTLALTGVDAALPLYATRDQVQRPD